MPRFFFVVNLVVPVFTTGLGRAKAGIVGFSELMAVLQCCVLGWPVASFFRETLMSGLV
jgi:hypothetical protein